MSTGIAKIDSAAVPSEPEPTFESGQRLAFWLFVSVSTVMFFVYAYLGRHIWFSVGATGDDWDFLAHRGINVHDLLASHGGHLVALPLVVYRALFNIFGLRSYRPYQILAIALHITAGGLLRVLMRRRAVNPWIATATASLFVCFGSAGQDILWAFQIAFSGALVLGLAQLLCADHDGGIDRRDWIGLGLGLAALFCSGVAVAMIGVVGVAALIRRGWRVAAFHVAPLALVYAAWSLHYGDSIITKNKFDIVRWDGSGIWSAFGQLGQIPPIGFILAALLVTGLVLAWRAVDGAERRRRMALPIGLLAGVLGFLTTSGITRAWAGVRFAGTSRYMHIVAALLMVPLAMAADELVRRRRLLLPVVLVALVVGIPGNLSKTTDSFAGPGVFDAYRQMIFSIPRMATANEVPSDLRPEPNQGAPVTMRWLLAGVKAGWLPKPRPLTAAEFATNTLRLSLYETDNGSARGCPALTGPTVRDLAKGKSLVIQGRVLVQLLPTSTRVLSGQVTFGNTFFGPPGPRTATAILQPLALRIVPKSPGASAC